jgi:hypothetical protein
MNMTNTTAYPDAIQLDGRTWWRTETREEHAAEYTDRGEWVLRVYGSRCGECSAGVYFAGDGAECLIAGRVHGTMAEALADLAEALRRVRG